MNAIVYTEYGPGDVLQPKEAPGAASKDDDTTEAFAELARGVHAALETYANVHRGSGHASMVSTRLFEQARDIVLEYLRLPKDQYVVIFCTPRRAEALKAHLEPGSYRSVSSQEIGLPLGVRALDQRSHHAARAHGHRAIGLPPQQHRARAGDPAHPHHRAGGTRCGQPLLRGNCPRRRGRRAERRLQPLAV